MNDKFLDDVKNVVAAMLELMGEKAYVECSADEKCIKVEIRPESPGQLIGKGGKVMEAFQYVLQRIMAREFKGKEIPIIIIDIDGYRRKREKELFHMAEDIAEQVSRSGKSVLLQPMSPWERKIVHLALKENEKVESESEDTEDGRQVRIKPGKAGSKSKEKETEDAV